MSWRLRIAAIFVVAMVTSGQSGCGCRGGIEQSYPAPKTAEVLEVLEQRAAAISSFRAESLMDYWTGKDRIKVTVLVMGKRGAYARFNALNPATDDVAADLACDGSNFQFIDFQKNCYMAGPCNSDAIAQMLRISLAPDDFLLLAAGSTPLIPSAGGTVKWNSDNGTEVVELESRDGQWKQKIVLDGADKRWDVLESTVRDADDKIEWKLSNKDYKELTTEDGKKVRVPSRTRFEQPKVKGDLAVRWKERTLNVELDQPKFTMEIPDGLPGCQ